jgi:hypothetical protein
MIKMKLGENVLTIFKVNFPTYSKCITKWTPIDGNTIKIRCNNDEFIFTYRATNDWILQTAKSLKSKGVNRHGRLHDGGDSTEERVCRDIPEVHNKEVKRPDGAGK